LFQARVSITQIPGNHQAEENKVSWLCNPFCDNTVYTMELLIKDTFSWSFLFNGETEAEAVAKAKAFLYFLKGKFPGLYGKISTLPLTSNYLKRIIPFQEISLPLPIYAGKLPLFNKFIDLFYFKTHYIILAYVLWQQSDAVVPKGILPINFEFQRHDFKIKIYVAIQKDPLKTSRISGEPAEIEGMLRYLITDIINERGEPARLIPTSKNTWAKILLKDVFWENPEQIETGRFFGKIADRIPESKKPGFASQGIIDFYISSRLPLPYASIPRIENIHYLPISKEDRNYIYLGDIVKTGVLTDHPALIEVNQFSQSMFIGGIPGVGKTRLIYQISKEFHEKALHVGRLYLNLGKGNQEQFYPADKVLKYGDPELKIPYFVKGDYFDKELQETATYLAASLGLRTPVNKITYLVMNSYLKERGKLPSLDLLFSGILLWFKKNPYHEEFQLSILRALKNRVLVVVKTPTLLQTMDLLPNYEPPTWLKDWFEGKSVFVDLSMCSAYTKLLLSNAIFQTIRTLMPDMESPSLKNLIFIDEAHQITKKSMYRMYNDDIDIARDELEKIFTQLMQEFRAKGLGFILADQLPSTLFECVTKLPSLKVLFRLDDECILRFTSNLEDRDYLSFLKDRHAYVINGRTGERYEIRTKEIDL